MQRECLVFIHILRSKNVWNVPLKLVRDETPKAGGLLATMLKTRFNPCRTDSVKNALWGMIFLLFLNKNEIPGIQNHLTQRGLPLPLLSTKHPRAGRASRNIFSELISECITTFNLILNFMEINRVEKIILSLR